MLRRWDTCAHFDDGTLWPIPGPGLDDIVWRLLHGQPSREDLVQAASVISAYSALLRRPRQRRDEIVRAVRLAADMRTDGGE